MTDHIAVLKEMLAEARTLRRVAGLGETMPDGGAVPWQAARDTADRRIVVLMDVLAALQAPGTDRNRNGG